LRLLARFVVAAAIALAHAAGAMAQPIHVGYTAAADFFPLFIAKEEGYFAKRGLDVEPVLLALNTIIPQALMASSLQIGGATPSVFLQAVDGGIDLVAIAGDTVTGPAVYQNSGVIARPDRNIKRPEDFIGKTVGVPGLGAFMHVLFRQWLASKGIDDDQVTFVEVAFFNMNDALRSGSVDAVLAGQPVLSRIIEAGTGQVAFHYIEDLPPNQSILLFACMREWAERNATAAKDFKAAIAEAGQFALRHPDQARAHIAKYTKMSPSLTHKLPLGEIQPDISEAQLAWWVDIMRRNDMLESSIDVGKLIFR
jgi:NitT/TauT family transport system substrate-binding protein